MSTGERQIEFEAWALAHSAQLLRLAYFLTGDGETAEDVVQAALAQLYHRWSRVRGIDQQMAYARRVMVNARISRVRARRLREVPLESVSDRPTGRTDTNQVEDRSELGPALARLPPRQRAVVALRYLEDLSEQETAATLGCSIGTVKSQASRGLAALREHLQPHNAIEEDSHG